MAPKKFIQFSQADFFFELDWDEKVDNTFIQVLVYEARLGDFVVGKSNTSSIRLAQGTIERKHGKRFSTKYCFKKLGVLEQRYETFGWMLSLPGVTYNKITNVVTTTDTIWNHIFKENTFAWAYRTYGDAKWEELQTIFAPPVIQEVPLNEGVIVLSSDDDEDVKTVVPPPKFHNIIHQNMGITTTPIHDGTTVVNVSSDSSSLNFNVWDYLTNYSDSEASLNTENSTANSKFRRGSTAPSPLKPNETVLPEYMQFPNVYGVSSSGSNVPLVEGKGKGQTFDRKAS